jgi:hypothetical protein
VYPVCTGGVGVDTGTGVVGTTGVGVVVTTGTVGRGWSAKRTFWTRPICYFFYIVGRIGEGLGGASVCYFCTVGTLDYVMAIYLSKISSSSSMICGSSYSSISSGSVIVASGGAMAPVFVGCPTFALPFSARVRVFVGGLYLFGGVSHIEDWAVFASICSISDCYNRSIKPITLG